MEVDEDIGWNADGQAPAVVDPGKQRHALALRIAERVLLAQVSAMLGHPEIPDLGHVVSAHVDSGVLHVTKHAYLAPYVEYSFGFEVTPW